MIEPVQHPMKEKMTLFREKLVRACNGEGDEP